MTMLITNHKYRWSGRIINHLTGLYEAGIHNYSMMTQEKVIYKVDGEIAWITLNRPEKLNALNREVWRLMAKYLNEAESDENVKVVIMTGEGRAFSAGDDIRDMLSLETEEDSKEFFEEYVAKAVEAFLNLSKPLIGAVNGLAYGGGTEILLLMDYVVASKNSVFAAPEIKLGLLPPLILTLGPFILGFRRALNMGLFGDEIDAEKALEYGLIDEIVDDDKLYKRALEVAKILSTYPLETLREAKKLINHCRMIFMNKEALYALEKLVLRKDSKLLMKFVIEK
jgi:enoyl-CoA hydratase/carnithine racemase